MLTRGSLSAQRGGGNAKWRGGATPLLASRRRRPLAAAPPWRRPQPLPLPPHAAPGGAPPRGDEAETEADAEAASGSLEAASATLSSGSLSSFEAEFGWEPEGGGGGGGEGEEEANPYGDAAAAEAAAAEGRAAAEAAIAAAAADADGAGAPALEALLAAAAAPGGAAAVTLEALEGIFPFPLDPFQKKAVAALLEGLSVVVCAPTGAGKTAIAEAAAAAALAAGKRVIYTTPLKALSNQKLLEARARFGTARCGLQTGDASLNPDGQVVVMTTEILRNIMYRTAEASGGGGGGATRDERLGDVGLVVLDEVHYLGDPNRGSVWEEVVINCPRHIQLLAMSATVKNPEDLGGWISQEHGECVTVRTRFRPVPLRWLFCHAAASGPRGPAALGELLDGSGRGLNPRLEMERFLKAEAR
ncbi:DEAD-box ATP-dependent RNA helicase, chloroplastic [Raphidocelis subcapitata]|uniref:DEAD-box ATP-dependent RNA helicase, chloroplastic n=1 Tax=Raphidocelis subcapitata TaxID=307507 RepID=A0A2V0PD84_9CHLO|nr:DEAD-box ATP-dependent RNA helicase, chloroplastic [Raphidocelis subcapitata]|eukprot:GBF97818.1 DEAD-box ATP-dependent RNA helicase, chloroplastic [Raphidocelis subcapitata]